jgi:hypothetical protein
MHPRNDPWCVLRVRSRFEQLVRAHLSGRGFEVFLPSRIVRRKLSTQIKTIELPLFPGYLFCRARLPQQRELALTPGVLYLHANGTAEECAITESEITALQTVTRSPIPYESGGLINSGHPVQVLNGPLLDLRALLVEVEKPRRIAVTLSALQQSVFIQLPEGTEVMSILDGTISVRVPA